MPRFAITTEGKRALASTTRETVLQLRGNTGLIARLKKWSISFDGQTADAMPVLVELERQSTDGTATGATERSLDPMYTASPWCSGFLEFTAQPTSSEILEQYLVHPQGGLVVVEYVMGEEILIGNAATSRLGITVTAPAAVNAVGYMHWME